MRHRKNSNLKRLAQTPLSDQIYQNLKWSLTIGEYEPGSALSIRKVAKKMGTSAMPVREALTRLASEQLLQSATNRSYRVADLEPKRVADQFFVRARLEGIATMLATPNMTNGQIDQLEELARQMVEDIEKDDNESYILRNCNFHFAIYEAAGNEELFWTIERLWAQTGPFLAHIVRDQDMPEDWQTLHTEIAKAIRDRDADRAAQLMEKDISWSTHTFKEMER
ncbi:MAG: GntR family transcriptional regulator [Rhodospirillales bacterium]|nr:GntR family transcriptional regulator [Rhodospirillales bacterium]MBT4038445.1 GntR family transcriptional regulator [Rhodospirillales bacterium]MBT4627908.1 GntR family transcriptional regulator [Rhodospirillales bacterium]MBT5351526.1 GntR family transcriptional regulator [Rhodospirillales bacterium]MBT5520015.1 GntR family transcriptional regulator [Rhodospirillales bacterium]